jgi:hypothetical protein
LGTRWETLHRALLATLLLLLFLLPVHDARAARNKLTPADFAPLTSLPWKQDGATLEGVLDAIYLETNPAILYPVLGVYLREIPVAQLERAFDFCIDHEGTQTPDKLVEFFLRIWAERDPLPCWKRTQALFHVVGIEEGWLSYDDWGDRCSPITVQDLAAIRASRFWLEGWSLAAFPLGVEKSALPRDERVRIMKEFADTWFAAFGTWPSRPGYDSYPGADYPRSDLTYVFAHKAEHLHRLSANGVSYDEFRFEIGLRRWLDGEPAAAPQVMELIHATRWPIKKGGWQNGVSRPSVELLMIWAGRDLPGLIRWAEELGQRQDPIRTDYLWEMRGFLMSRVDEKTRARWLAEAKPKPGAPPSVPRQADATGRVPPSEGDDNTGALLGGWAEWDPQPALAAAVATKNADIIRDCGQLGAYGPFPAQPYYTSHHGMGVIRDFDLTRLPEKLRHDTRSEWGIAIMEQWGDIDIGEAARYGLDFMLRNDYAPRENLIKLFNGDDKYSSDSDMIDRTFCALRVWAVVRPDEMKPWVATQKDPKLRAALTWLMENPWGWGPKQDPAAR